ncbi:MAG: GNAT family N-acetyltransferase [Thaumarchaeota archaeon]|nr:GNAT family N-acetyltransferase [Nitrososphaerota archaeon]
MGFIRNVWGGHDYIPSVWDDWMKDRSAKMFVLEVDGKQVAMNHVRFPGDGTAWFEGVRVHPDYRGRGLATLLGENAMRVASEKDIQVYRLTSNSLNRAAHRQVARMGFVEVSRFSVYEVPKGTSFHREERVRRATLSDERKIRRLIQESSEWRLGGGVMWDGFTAVSLTPAIVSKMVRSGSVFLLGDAVAISKLGGEGKDVWKQVCFIGGGQESSVKLVQHTFAYGRKADWDIAFIPQGSALIRALGKVGLRRSLSLILFEKRAANG